MDDLKQSIREIVSDIFDINKVHVNVTTGNIQFSNVNDTEIVYPFDVEIYNEKTYSSEQVGKIFGLDIHWKYFSLIRTTYTYNGLIELKITVRQNQIKNLKLREILK